MPITFAPASPFNARALADYGATQGRQFAPTPDAMQQRILQASIATAQNETSANNQANENEARLIQQSQALDYQRQGQLRQFAQEQQIQDKIIAERQRSQMAEFAFIGQKVSHQEQQDMMRREAGLAEIQRQIENNTLTPEQAYPAIMELKTGINFTQRRMQEEQAQNMAAQADLRRQETAQMQENVALGSKFQLDMAAKGITVQPFFDPTTGRVHMVGVDPKTGRLYNPFLEHASKQDDQGQVGGEWAHLGTQGRFDERKALADAKAYAEGQLPVVKGLDGKDSNAAARAELITRRIDGMRAEFRDASRKAPVQAPQAEPQSQPSAGMGQFFAPPEQMAPPPAAKPIANEFMAQIEARDLNPDQKAAATNIVQGIQEIMAKPPQTLTAKDKADLIQFRNALKMYLP